MKDFILLVIYLLVPLAGNFAKKPICQRIVSVTRLTLTRIIKQTLNIQARSSLVYFSFLYSKEKKNKKKNKKFLYNIFRIIKLMQNKAFIFWWARVTMSERQLQVALYRASKNWSPCRKIKCKKKNNPQISKKNLKRGMHALGVSWWNMFNFIFIIFMVW